MRHHSGISSQSQSPPAFFFFFFRFNQHLLFSSTSSAQCLFVSVSMCWWGVCTRVWAVCVLNTRQRLSAFFTLQSVVAQHHHWDYIGAWTVDTHCICPFSRSPDYLKIFSTSDEQLQCGNVTKHIYSSTVPLSFHYTLYFNCTTCWREFNMVLLY